MNFRVYILASSAFIVGIVELIIGGILDQIAADLHISISKAGQLISVFSLAFAVSSPVLLNATAKVERKKLYLWTLFFFLIGNLMAVFSPNYTVLLLSRIVSAATASLLIVLSVTVASNLVKPEYKGRAIGVIYMGVSGSLVLGVPLGMTLGNLYGWRAPFVLISALTVLAAASIFFFLKETPPNPIVPLPEQLKALRNSKIISAQFISILMLTGHLTLYAYFTPFLQSALHLDATMISVMYFVFGLAAVAGGGMGGFASDKLGIGRSILTIIPLFAVAMILMPMATKAPFWVFLIVMIIWSALSWSISPAQQSYLIQIAPKTADIQLSINNSASHIGIAAGSAIGGIVIEKSSVMYNSWVGVLFILAALLCAFYSLTKSSTAVHEKAVHE
ncbi:DHA1 family purine base/nucleoside efflux pump-like MFS transporter [Bacillus fengqiuensis]|nr:DHA1 family purine base/nucleoside efflux pump-like MFS transporter [Bacillus fengqiuensis]